MREDEQAHVTKCLEVVWTLNKAHIVPGWARTTTLSVNSRTR